jgi:uncharacterized SAM-binding protein YcdF (DUF218 family)
LAHTAISGSPAASGTGLRTRPGRGRIIAFSLSIIVSCALFLAAAGFLAFTSQIEHIPGATAGLKADGIVVLTGGKSRIETAIGLLEDGKARRLLISGVHRDTSRASIRRAVKGDATMFSCCVDIDKAALDTIGNAEQAAGWARQNGFGTLIVVTSDYHMPRSLLELRRKLPGTDIRPYAVASIPLSLTDPAALRVLLPEYAKYVAAQFGLGVREQQGAGALAANLPD